MPTKRTKNPVRIEVSVLPKGAKPHAVNSDGVLYSTGSDVVYQLKK